MFRLASVAVVALCAGAASAKSQAEIVQLSTACTATYANIPRAERSKCENIMELEKCLSLAELPELENGPDHDTFTSVSLVLSRGQASNTACKSFGNIKFNIDAGNPGEIFRFSTEKASVIDIHDRVSDLKRDAAYVAASNTAFAQQELDIETVSANIRAAINKKVDALQGKQAGLKIRLDTKLTQMKTSTNTVLDSMADRLTTTIGDLGDLVDEEIAKLTADTSAKLANFKKKKTVVANSTDSMEWVSQYKLIQVARAPANTENGHAGRMFYKIDFNTNNKGFWYENRDEIRRGCSLLSQDMEKVDGIDRGLKPACDRPGSYCDDDGVSLAGSYLSHCGCDSYPRTSSCVGMTTNFLRGAAMYNRRDSWNGYWLQRHDGRDCHHHWSNAYGNHGVRADFTICTGSNDKYTL